MKSDTPARDGRSIRWDRHRAERRLELVRAARAAVHALGAQVSMDEIASHAGTSKTVFYRYFGDREGLRLAVAERVTAHMERRLLEAVDGPSSGADALHRMVEVYLTVAATSPQVYAFAVAPRPPPRTPPPPSSGPSSSVSTACSSPGWPATWPRGAAPRTRATRWPCGRAPPSGWCAPPPRRGCGPRPPVASRPRRWPVPSPTGC